ncbi:hypothetical protein UFOVP1382_159 [uncultured Caudovirales phage]|uniref:Uncharacterized protein n=1 Tax=uncultured Caudovirales phage TaxID=2100421 RepID=A0A6J5S0Q2_9CAUD|nr:hypothetical protein UFOVP1382_159 [uncultured Caudovirales phage]
MSKPDNSALLATLARIRGVAREEHFKAGGTLASWRGVKQVTRNAKREAGRKACRGRVQ